MSVPVIEEVLPHFYRAEIPLPNNPLKQTNAYIITAGKRNLIIDTGMNRQECKSAMAAALRQLHVNLEETDFFITHLHVDHLGLVGEMAAKSSTVYFNQPDAAVIDYQDLWQLAISFARQHGFPESILQSAVEMHPANKYRPKDYFTFTLLKEGDAVLAGDYRFKCVETPGHTPGHLCLYEADRKILVSGDHILGNITPNIAEWFGLENPLRQYLQSLDKIDDLEINLVLPGHRDPFPDCRKRIRELKIHHRHRLDEVMQILKSDGMSSAFQVASKMNWDIIAESWELFPLMQKWFATGEAVSHLRYLELEGSVQSKEAGGKIVFGPVC
jgi:glyoxylase-like metal-dependent hydrolase (beta-lactamase superfamily II)